MKKSLFSFIALTLLSFNLSSAQADPTYAVLDSNGNVTNIIVCGSACASGEFGGNKVVLQVAADPTTGGNRGGFWQGPGTTTYDSGSGTFTMTESTPSINSSVSVNLENKSTTINTETTNIVNNDGTETEITVNTEEREEIKTTSSVILDGKRTTSFTYRDTVGSNLFTRNGFVYGYSDNTKATMSVNVDKTTTVVTIDNNKLENVLSTTLENNSESISFNNKQTTQEIQDSVTNANLSLLNSKIQTLISLLGSWVK